MVILRPSKLKHRIMEKQPELGKTNTNDTRREMLEEIKSSSRSLDGRRVLEHLSGSLPVYLPIVDLARRAPRVVSL